MAFSLEEIDHATEYALGQLDYASLKEKQREALTAFVRGSDTFVSLPTRRGTSLLLSSASGD